MDPCHEPVGRHRDTSGYRAVLLLVAVVMTACITTSCTNPMATTTAAVPASFPSTTAFATSMTPTGGAGPSSIGAAISGGAFPMPPASASQVIGIGWSSSRGPNAPKRWILAAGVGVQFQPAIWRWERRLNVPRSNS